ncbi:MAG: hypothetical protein ACPGWR_05560, partial [Ardenticatenaceae bacterium]
AHQGNRKGLPLHVLMAHQGNRKGLPTCPHGAPGQPQGALQEFAPKVALLREKAHHFVIPRETRNLRPANKRFLVSLEMTNK